MRLAVFLAVAACSAALAGDPTTEPVRIDHVGLVALYMANWHSGGDRQLKQPVAMALPTVILEAGCLKCWAARFLPGRVAG